METHNGYKMKNKESIVNSEQVAEVLKQLAQDPDIIELVQRIESKPETTQDHYGDYGTALAKLSGGNKKRAQAVAVVLILAGANPNGVKNGLAQFV
jgi:hypothetical protein